MSNAVVEHWTAALRAALPRLLGELGALRPLAGRAAIVLLGSTTHGLDDEWSDLDVELLVSDDLVRQVKYAAGTSFFAFQLNGKPGHFTLESPADMRHRIVHCDFPLISELRSAQVLSDLDGAADRLIRAARQPMPDDVRHAWLRFHYTEMRGEHRAADNPIERRDALAVLQATVATLRYALQTAMVLDRAPYPYVKWLAAAAALTPTGARVVAKAEDLLDLLATNALRVPGPEKMHPISLKLREIRALLVESMQQAGIDEPWQREWWLHMHEARRAVDEMRWPIES